MGGWGNASGPGLVVSSMFRSMLSGTTSAMTLGLTAAAASSMIWGTATLPFIIASSVGFAMGSLRWYFASTQEALLQLDRYPSLLRLHVLANFPWLPEYARRDASWFTRERFHSNWVHKSVLVASWLSAQPALDDIHHQVETALVQAYVESPTQDK
ncbi:sugar transporter [Hirsutella rhossiliensis]|uniref:Sugar transporter n=1 Tax=Hirsutella rhossiliensis TaxID=111463 RepID=A0A9P8SMZ7_9HYPO|nr:sugar transporter [Hirsutella rhossiliensis]KAH0968536.1 sugar transporter [Hirsutella rhossiliensis]